MMNRSQSNAKIVCQKMWQLRVVIVMVNDADIKKGLLNGLLANFG